MSNLKDEDQILSEIYLNSYDSILEEFINRKVLLFSYNLIKLHYGLLFTVLTSLPFCYLSTLMPFNQKNFIKTNFIQPVMICRVENAVFEISAVSSKPVISMGVTLQDNSLSNPQPGRVVLAQVRPKVHSISNRRLSYGVRPPRSYRTYTETYTLTMMESRAIFAVRNGNIATMSTSFKQSDIKVTKHYLVALPEYKSLGVEENTYKFIEMLSSNSRLEPLTKILNFQEWSETKDGIPVLVFNADGTHGQYRHNQGITKVINNIITEFVTNNPHLQFLLEYRPGDAEHPNQKSQLESVLLTQREAGTYQLGKTAHRMKTSELNNVMPDNVKTIPEWFIYNGEETINYLVKLWDEGHLNNSVEDINIFKEAIESCIQIDIDNFRKTGLPETAIAFPGQIRSMDIGAQDCGRFNTLIRTCRWDAVDKLKVEAFAEKLLTKAQVRAAYIHNGMHMFPQGSTAHRNQLHHSETFVTSFTLLTENLQKELPHLKHDAVFQKKLKSFKEVLNGDGNFNKIVTGKTYKSFLEDLRNPKKQLHLFPRNANIFYDS